MDNSLIKRQAVIDALRYYLIGKSPRTGTLTCRLIENEVINKLPTAEPKLCEDAVSREAVLDALRTCYDTETITYDNGDEYIHYGDAVGEVEQLPSVTPKQRTGKWIFTKDYYWICSECGKNPTRGVGYVQGSSELFPHCPYCGSRNEVTT